MVLLFCRRLLLLAATILSLSSAPALAANPFGVMLWPNAGEDLSLVAARAAGLGVAWFRPPTVFLDRWAQGQPCHACDAMARSGLKVVLTVRNGGRDSAPRRPSTPPNDIEAYKQTLATVLRAWKPAVLVVEHEEDEPAFFSGGSDAAAAYGRELEAACDVAHAQGIACTNGGLSGRSAALLAWAELLKEGDADAACSFARRAFGAEASGSDGYCACRHPTDLSDGLRRQRLEAAERLLATYRKAPIDVVNFHWFATDASVFAQTADALSKAAGKPVMSNEIGQLRADDDPTHVRPLLRAAFAVPLKVAVWVSIDTPSTVSLFNPDGTLRPSGREFLHQMSGRR